LRIVSLVPSITEALCRLGLADELVAVTDYCVHPAAVVATKHRIGGTKNPDLERIRALAPDLVIANTDEQRAETLAALEEGPYDLLVTETDSLVEVAETWSQLGAVTKTVRAAEMERAALEDAMRHARDASRREPRVVVFVPIWKNPWMAAGGGTYVTDLLLACGFENQFGRTEEKWPLFAPTLSHKQAAALAPTKGPLAGRVVHVPPAPPDAVLLPSEPYRFEAADRAAFKAVGVPRDRAVLVDGELLTWWLSRSVAALEHFTRLRRRLALAVTGP
jgi:ABC-type Fe3+-hydroxamate transport system substrate-binding protein